MKLQLEIAALACLAVSIGLSRTAMAREIETFATSDLAEQLFRIVSNPGFEIEDLDRYVAIEKKAISTTRFGTGEIFEIPARSSTPGLLSAGVRYRSRNARGLVSVWFLLDATAGECSPIEHFARLHRLTPHPFSQSDPMRDLSMQTYYDSKKDNVSVAVAPHIARPECVGELSVVMIQPRLE